MAVNGQSNGTSNGHGGKPQVLICGTVIWSHEEVKEMENEFEILHLESPTREHFLEECKEGGRLSKIQALFRQNDSASKIGVFDAPLIEGLPKSLKFVCHNGAGYDMIDVNACTKRGIRVSNVPTAVDDATATTAMYLIIGALRGFEKGSVNGRQGKFKSGLKPGSDPEGKTLGIVGMGGIGRALARRALGFQMKILCYNRSPLSSEIISSNFLPEQQGSITYCSSLDDLLRRSDVVSLNLPLNSETKGKFGREQFGLMKDGSVLVNTARGGVVNEEALLEALDSGKLLSAGLDVFPDEPNINPRLLSNPRLSLLPHMGTETRETQHKMEVRALDNVKAALRTGKVTDVVIEQRGVF